MNKLWMANLAPEVTDEDLKQFIGKYAPGIECTEIVRVDGDGSRPGAILSFAINDMSDMSQISSRLNGMFWHGRALACVKMM
jgi:RNA recognition motif. (a.k.a. RRM, RBD, or RNP domain)